MGTTVMIMVVGMVVMAMEMMLLMKGRWRQSTSALKLFELFICSVLGPYCSEFSFLRNP